MRTAPDGVLGRPAVKLFGFLVPKPDRAVERAKHHRAGARAPFERSARRTAPADDARRDAKRNRAVGNVARDHRARADDRALADPNASQHDHTGSEPRVIFNQDIASDLERLLNDLTIRLSPMIIWKQRAVRSDLHTASDDDGSFAGREMTALMNMCVVTDLNPSAFARSYNRFLIETYTLPESNGAAVIGIRIEDDAIANKRMFPPTDVAVHHSAGSDIPRFRQQGELPSSKRRRRRQCG